MSKGKLIVMSGCSGVGKSTVLGEVMKQRDDLLFSVSATTRAPRKDEKDGVNYTFVSLETFQSMIAQDAFLEYDGHMESWYGTPKQQLEEKLERGIVLLDIEPKGAFAVRAVRPDVTLIFIAPPSMEELERRLRSRGDTSEAQIEKRLARAHWEMEQSVHYDHVVVNEQVETCVAKILEIIAQVAD